MNNKKIFLISDFHFYHKKIIEYANRPFSTVEEMNETMIENWNKVIKKNYKVIIAGDFALCGKEQMKQILNRLNGYKILILGNHDRSYASMMDIGFNEVVKYSIVLNDKYIVSHKPIFNNSIVFHINVCVEQINYTPIELTIIGKMYQNTSVQRCGFINIHGHIHDKVIAWY